MLAEQVWDMNLDSDTNVVEVAVRRLRGKLDDPFDHAQELVGRSALFQDVLGLEARNGGSPWPTRPRNCNRGSTGSMR